MGPVMIKEAMRQHHMDFQHGYQSSGSLYPTPFFINKQCYRFLLPEKLFDIGYFKDEEFEDDAQKQKFLDQAKLDYTVDDLGIKGKIRKMVPEDFAEVKRLYYKQMEKHPIHYKFTDE